MCVVDNAQSLRFVFRIVNKVDIQAQRSPPVMVGLYVAHVPRPFLRIILILFGSKYVEISRGRVL